MNNKLASRSNYYAKRCAQGWAYPSPITEGEFVDKYTIIPPYNKAL